MNRSSSERSNVLVNPSWSFVVRMASPQAACCLLAPPSWPRLTGRHILRSSRTSAYLFDHCGLSMCMIYGQRPIRLLVRPIFPGPWSEIWSSISALLARDRWCRSTRRLTLLSFGQVLRLSDFLALRRPLPLQFPILTLLYLGHCSSLMSMLID